MTFLAEYLFHTFLNGRHTGHPAHKNDFLNIFGCQIGILQCRGARFFKIVEQVGHQIFQFGAGESDIQMFGATLVCGDKGKVHMGFHGTGQFHFCLFRRLFQTLQGHLVCSKIDTLLFFEFRCQVIDDPQVKIFTPQMGVSIG